MGRESINVVGDRQFRDHHRYSQQDCKELERETRGSNATAFLTTEKDMTRLMGDMHLLEDFVRDLPVFYAGITVDILSGNEILNSLIDECLVTRAT
jgi:tetraacyldisaccharide-1-P 4'-kinase